MLPFEICCSLVLVISLFFHIHRKKLVVSIFRMKHFAALNVNLVVLMSLSRSVIESSILLFLYVYPSM